MPLVVQDSDPNDEIEQWQNKLTGKTISEEESSETVRVSSTSAIGTVS